MNIHLKTTLTFLAFNAIVAGLYFFTAETLVLFILTIVYGVIYVEIKKIEENKNGGKTEENN